MAAPTISSVTPAAGPITGTTSVAIVGTNLDTVTAVNFGLVAATSFILTDPTHMSAIAPAHAAGVVDITVINPTATSATSSADHFTFEPIPVVSSVAPGGGPTAGATSVVIHGSGFTGVTGAAGVKFGATNATSYVVNSDTQITAVAPAHSAATVDITVTSPGGVSTTSAADDFVYAGLPTVTSVTPLPGDEDVEIVGTNFLGVTDVEFGGHDATSFTVTDSTHIVATYAPLSAPATVDVTVTAFGGVSATSGADLVFDGTYVQPDGTEDATYFMDVEISPATLADGSLFARLNPDVYPQVGVIASS
jgi:hypothetical protein